MARHISIMKHGAWGDFPHVILFSYLTKTTWWKELKCKYILNVSEETYIKDPVRNSNSNNYPHTGHIKMEDRGIKVVVHVDWCDRLERFEVCLSSRFSNSKSFGSRYYEGAVERIHQALLDSKDGVDTEVQDREYQHERKRQQQEEKEMVEEALGIEVTMEASFYTKPSFTYGKTDYKLQFRSIDMLDEKKYIKRFGRGSSANAGKERNRKKQMYKVQAIGGEFTLDEIKVLVKFLGTNPKAIRQRLVGRED